MPAYNAQETLSETLKNLPKGVIDEVILIDDCSSDQTYKTALAISRKQGLKLKVFRNSRNLGYGGNMKQCFTKALAAKADIVVEIHPDNEYGSDAALPAIKKINSGAALVLGTRFSKGAHALESGMFVWKYPVTRFLTLIDNLVLGTDLSDCHQGFRVYNSELLRRIDYRAFSNNFLFTFEIIVQTRLLGERIDQVKVKTNYVGRKRGVSFWTGLIYSLGTFKVLVQYLQIKLGRKSLLFSGLVKN